LENLPKRIKVKTGRMEMKLKTKIFELSKGRYPTLAKLAKAMAISKDLIYRVRRGERGIHEKFIIGAKKAFPEYEFDYFFYVFFDD